MIATLLFALVILLGIVVSVFALFAIAAIHAKRTRVGGELGKRARQIPHDSVSPSVSEHEGAQKAIIRCGRIPPAVQRRFVSTGYVDCRTLNRLYGGNLSCAVSCLGLGTCAASCPSDAIILRNGRAYVSDACNGCGVCVTACPKKLISLVPVTLKDEFYCAAQGTPDATCECPVARSDCRLDLRAFPESGFKLLSRWGILKAKSR